MQITLEHVAGVKGIPPRSKLTRTMIGTLLSTVTVEEASLKDFVRFKVGEHDFFARDGLFFQKARYSMQELAITDHSERIKSDICPPDVDASVPLAANFKKGDRSFWPSVSDFGFNLERKSREIIFSIKGKRTRNLEGLRAIFDKSDLERAHLRAQSFADNFRVIEGTLYARCHEPVLAATRDGLRVGSTSIFDRFVDRPIPGDDRLAEARGSLPTDHHIFALSDEDAANEFLRKIPWVGALSTTPWRNLPRELFSSSDSISNLELRRFSKIILQRCMSFTEGYCCGMNDLSCGWQGTITARNNLINSLIAFEFGSGSSSDLSVHLQAMADLSFEMARLKLPREEEWNDYVERRENKGVIITPSYDYSASDHLEFQEDFDAFMGRQLDRQDTVNRHAFRL